MRGHLGALSSMIAHPITDGNHHRTITLFLSADPATRELRIRIDYRLELAEVTALLEAQPFIPPDDGRGVLARRTAIYSAWAKVRGPQLAAQAPRRSGVRAQLPTGQRLRRRVA